MPINSFSWMIGGPQGSGVDSSATLFARSVTVGGLWIYGKREYHSNIVGEHSYFHIRVSDEPVGSTIDPVHLLATFENTTADIHAREIVPGGALLYDPSITNPQALQLNPEVLLVPVNYRELLDAAAQELDLPVSKVLIMKNTISVAASLALVEFGIEHLGRGLEGTFRGRKAKLVEPNLVVARKAYQSIPKNLIKQFPYRIRPLPDSEQRLLINGTTATALGKLKAGCSFQTYYPITPASDESVYLEDQTDHGIMVLQCEDEIAAVEMAIGASLVGSRASTSTSGPGFSLMVEGIGWAGMNEVPLVVHNYQRAGPATGLPTRHEQGDLLFSLHFGHGEFPRIVVAPGDPEECFYDTFECFNYADRYQTPVIVLVDKALANNTQTLPLFDESNLVIDRGYIAGIKDLEKYGVNGSFKRFAFQDGGISPRTFPGTEGGIFWMSGDEHDESGHITEDPANRVRMHTKRMEKLAKAATEIAEDQQVKFYGPAQGDITIVSWGSTKGAILDALPELAEIGLRTNFLQVHLLWPFPTEAVKKILDRAQVIVGVEMNYSGQLARLIRCETGIEINHQVLKWNGRPMSQTEIVSSIQKIGQGARRDKHKVVLHGGL